MCNQSLAGGNYADDHFSSSYDRIHQQPSNIVENVFILVLTGVAVLLGLIVLVFTLGIMCDRWCCFCRCFQGIHNDESRYIEGGVVARDAGLTEISQSERRRILDKLFVTKVKIV